MSFISDYLLTTEGNESPLEYHTWSMLAALSAFAGKRFWFDLGHLRFYPHLYVVLVGAPAMTKTSAMGFAKDIVRRAAICPVAASQITKEALTLKMSSTLDGKPRKDKFIGQKFFEYAGKTIEYNQYAIFASELVDFIAVNPQGFLDFLTNAWDDPIIEVETKHKGHDFVENPCINFMGCMTPEKLKGFLKMSILTGGFARRTAFVFSSNIKSVPIPIRTAEQIAAYDRCIQFGKDIQTLSGPFTWTEETKEFYVEWYHENKSTIKDRHPTTRGWYGSKPEILWKVAMLISLAETRELVIHLPAYKLALRYCEMLERTLERVFEGSGINPNAMVANQICNMLEQMDLPMNRKHLEMLFFDQATNLNDLRDTLTHLINVGRLKEVTITRQGTGELLGNLIATPECLSRYRAEELEPFLRRPAAPPRLIETDCSALQHRSESQILEPTSSDATGGQSPAGSSVEAEISAPPTDRSDPSSLLNPNLDSPSAEQKGV